MKYTSGSPGMYGEIKATGTCRAGSEADFLRSTYHVPLKISPMRPMLHHPELRNTITPIPRAGDRYHGGI
jgi:hypothetical protein